MQPDEEFAGYRVVRTLGSSRTGTMYEAEYLEDGSRVALHVIEPDRGGPVPEQFIASMRAVSGLSHPSIATITRFGVEGDLASGGCRGARRSSSTGRTWPTPADCRRPTCRGSSAMWPRRWMRRTPKVFSIGR